MDPDQEQHATCGTAIFKLYVHSHSSKKQARILPERAMHGIELTEYPTA